MKRKFFVYLFLAAFMGCKTGGPAADPASNLNKSMVVAFSQMLTDKGFSNQEGVKFAESGGTKFSFNSQSAITFSGATPCSTVKSDVTINGSVTDFDPAVCQVEDVGYYYDGSYFSLGKYYFISARKSGSGSMITFAFNVQSPKSGVYRIDGDQVVGQYFKATGTSRDGYWFGVYSDLYGSITVNTDNGFRLSSPYLYGSDIISLSIGCCSH